MAEQAGETQLSMQDAIRLTMNNEVPASIAPVTEPEQSVTDEPAKQTPDVATIVTETQPAIPDYTAWLKEQFGPDADVDIIKTKLNAAAPEPLFKEPTFENEASKKIYEALLSGKENEVAGYLNEKQFLSSIKEKSPEQIVKEGWKREFGYTDAEAQRRFSRTYGVDETLDDEDRVIEEKTIAKQVEKEADKYKEFFARYEQNIKLPELQAPAPASVEPVETEEAKKAFSYSTELNKRAFAETANIPFQLKDETKGVDYKGSIPLPKNEIEGIKTNISGNEAKWIEARYIKPDGTFNDDQFATDVYVIANLPKIVQDAAIDAKEQTWKAKLMADKNYRTGEREISGDSNMTSEEQKRAAYREFWG